MVQTRSAVTDSDWPREERAVSLPLHHPFSPFPGQSSSLAPQPAEKVSQSCGHRSRLCSLGFLSSARPAPHQALGSAQEECDTALLPTPKRTTDEARTHPFTARGSPDSTSPPIRPSARTKATSLLTQTLWPIRTPAWPWPVP